MNFLTGANFPQTSVSNVLNGTLDMSAVMKVPTDCFRCVRIYFIAQEFCESRLLETQRKSASSREKIYAVKVFLSPTA
jgi:hypothetical protein